MRYYATALDTETHLIPPSGKVRTAPVAPPLVCSTFAAARYDYEKCEGLIEWDEPRAMFKLLELLQLSDYVIMHNSTFDVAVLSRAYPELIPQFKLLLSEGRLLDTRVMYALRKPGMRVRYSLKNLIKDLFDFELAKGEVRCSFRQGMTLTDEQREYAIADAVWTLKAFEKLSEIPYGGMVKDPPYFVQHKVFAETPQNERPTPDAIFSSASAWLAYNIEAVGLEVDIPRLLELHANASSHVLDHMKELHRHGLAKATRDRAAEIEQGTPTEAKTPRAWTYWPEADQMHRVFKGHNQTCPVKWSLCETELREAYGAAADSVPGIGVPPMSEKTGKLSLEYDFWKEYKDLLPGPLQTHLELGKTRKLLSAFFEPMRRAAKDRLIVHPHIGVAFADTGRWTCWRPNLQNQPKSIRHMYRSPVPGDVLVSADYKSLEMYTAVEAMHQLGITYGPLREVLDADGDTHTNTAVLMFGACDGKDDPRRKVAKICNFALLGGMGPTAFRKTARAAGLDWTLQNAADIRSKWFDTFHDCSAFLQLFRIDPWSLCPPVYHKKGWLELNSIPTEPWPSRWELSHALNDGAVYSVRLPDGRVVPNRRYSQAANIFFQGLGADVVSLAFNNVCASGLKVCIVVHDSITVTTTPKSAEMAGHQLVREMQKAQQTVLPCGVKIPLPEFEVGEFWS
jgi:hypothetical protein